MIPGIGVSYLEPAAARRGNQAQAARSLGLSYHKFRDYLRKYG